MTIITPTFGERPKANGDGTHITEPHEPLPNEPFTISNTIPVNLPFELPPPAGPAEPVLNQDAAPATPEKAEQPYLKVALIGTAPSSRLLAPYSDPSWEIWGCSPGNMGGLPRVTRWFELHANLLWPECAAYGPAYIEWLRKQTFPIYMQNQSMVPSAITFPKDELLREFGQFGMFNLTSSFAWMIAFAIKEGAKEIALFGVDMASRDEYILQRGGGQNFMLEAARRGIKVLIPHESDLMQPPPLYGYAETYPHGRKIGVRKQEIKTRIASMTVERDKLTHNITYLQGALEDVEYMETVWAGAQ